MEIKAIKQGDDQFALISSDDLCGCIITREELSCMTASGLPLREAFGRFVVHSRPSYGGFFEEAAGNEDGYFMPEEVIVHRIDFDAFDALDDDVDVDVVRFDLNEFDI